MLLSGKGSPTAANPPPMLRMDTPALEKGGYTLRLTPFALCGYQGVSPYTHYPPFARAGDQP